MNLLKSRAPIAFLLAILFSLATIGIVSTGATASASLLQSGDGARRITPDEVRELLKNNKAVVIDVRGESAYKTGHIKGALWIPVNEIANRAKDLPRDKTIVTYCS